MELAPDWVRRLGDAVKAYASLAGPAYDETFEQVVGTVARDGSLGKPEICALATWKRSAQGRWLGTLLAIPDRDLRAMTRGVVDVVRAAEDPVDAARCGRSALRDAGLPGCGHGDAIPSAILCAIDPVRLAVVDRRAKAFLRGGLMPLTVPSRLTYESYIEVITEVRAAVEPWLGPVTGRQVDQGLYVLGASAVS